VGGAGEGDGFAQVSLGADAVDGGQLGGASPLPHPARVTRPAARNSGQWKKREAAERGRPSIADVPGRAGGQPVPLPMAIACLREGGKRKEDDRGDNTLRIILRRRKRL